MAINRLGLYNMALRAIGERSLSSLSENREPRRILDDIWQEGHGFIRVVLEQGLWNHAMRGVLIDSSPSVTPNFGFTYAFDRPDDFVRLVQISDNENYTGTLERYETEGPYFYADVDPIYMRFVSDDQDWGADLSLWPESFSKYAGHRLALELCPRLKNDMSMEVLEKRVHKMLIEARSKDAMEEPSRYPPIGSWRRARRGGRSGDGGSNTNLIG